MSRKNDKTPHSRKLDATGPLVVGLTGGVGSGKSLVARQAVELGAALIDVDRLARDLIAQDTGILQSLQLAFGPDILTEAGKLRRPVLAERAFMNEASTLQLNSIVWPTLLRRLTAVVAEQRQTATQRIVIVDMAVLFEAGAQNCFDHIAVVVAPAQKRMQWLMADRGWSKEEARRRMDAQWSDEEKRMRSHSVINNNGRCEDLIGKVRLWVEKIEASPSSKRLIF